MTPIPLRFAGAVLCGGGSRRMGRDKAFVTIDGRPLVGRVAGALTAAGARPVVAIGGDATALAAAGIAHVVDRHRDEGPLGGVLTALHALDADVVAVLATDLVDPDPATIRAVVAALGAADVAVPVIGGRRHVHHAVWRRACLPALDAAFAGGERAIKRALAAVVVREVTGLDPDHLADADDPDELTAAAARVTGRRPAAGTIAGNEEAMVEVPEVDVAGLAEVLATGAVLIDVREPDEYEEVRVPGGRLIPLATVPDHLGEIPTTGPVYVVCRSGGRSRKAVEFLRARGVDAVNVGGGTLAWVEAGRPVERGASR